MGWNVPGSGIRHWRAEHRVLGKVQAQYPWPPSAALHAQPALAERAFSSEGYRRTIIFFLFVVLVLHKQIH